MPSWPWYTAAAIVKETMGVPQQIRLVSLALAASYFLEIGCAIFSGSQVILHRSAQGVIFLESAPIRGTTMLRRPSKIIETDHPVFLEPNILARALRAIRIHKPMRPPELASDTPDGARVFSEADVEFLAPHVSAALAQATADQQMGFRIGPPSESGNGTIEGKLYVHQHALHLTLTQLRGIHQLDKQEFLFVPQAARRPDRIQSSDLFGQNELKTLVIDYELLAKLPSSQQDADHSEVTSGSPEKAAERDVRDEELRSVRDLITKQATELETLKEELRSLKRQLAELEAERNSPQKQKRSSGGERRLP